MAAQQKDKRTVESQCSPSNSNTDGIFANILKDPKFFVDKTLLIKTLIEDKDQQILLTASPLFGKTVIINMLKTFFEAEKNKERLQDQTNLSAETSSQQLQEKYNLFKDLKIYKCSGKCQSSCVANASGDFKVCENKSLFYEHCGQYPVISLDFANLMACSGVALLESLRMVLKNLFEDHNYLIKHDDQEWIWADNNMLVKHKKQVANFLEFWESNRIKENWTNKKLGEKLVYLQSGFQHLFEFLVAYHGRKIILLIDELDAPIIKSLYDVKDVKNTHISQLENVVDIMKDLMCFLIKSANITKYVKKTVIFSTTVVGSLVTLKNFNDVKLKPFLSPDHEYFNFFGFTEDEVKSLLDKNFDNPKEQSHAEANIKEWYSAYEVLDKDVKIYNPFSIIKYLQNHIASNYWVQPNNNKNLSILFTWDGLKKIKTVLEYNDVIVIDIIADKYLNVNHLHNLQRSINAKLYEMSSIGPFYVRSEHMQYLTDRGYFKIVHRNEHQWTLQLPNKEVKEEFLMLRSVNRNNRSLDALKCNKFLNALAGLEIKNHDTYVQLVKALEDLYDKKTQPVHHSDFRKDLELILKGREDMWLISVDFPVDGAKWLRNVDLFVVTADKGIIMEAMQQQSDYTVNHRNVVIGTAKSTLAQIINKGYYKAFECVPEKYRKNITNKILIGLSFCDGKVTIKYLENPNLGTDTDQNQLVNASKSVSVNEF